MYWGFEFGPLYHGDPHWYLKSQNLNLTVWIKINKFLEFIDMLNVIIIVRFFGEIRLWYGTVWCKFIVFDHIHTESPTYGLSYIYSQSKSRAISSFMKCSYLNRLCRVNLCSRIKLRQANNFYLSCYCNMKSSSD